MPLIKEQAEGFAMKNNGERHRLRRIYLENWNQYIVDRETFFKVVRDMYRSKLYSQNTIPGDVIWSMINHLEKIRYANCGRNWMAKSGRRSGLYDALKLPATKRSVSYNAWRRKYELLRK